MMNIATRHNRYLANATAANRTVDSGNPIMVCAIVAANDSAGAVTLDLTDADGTTLMTLEIGANSTVTVEAPWLADNGLIVGSGAATTIVTVLWRPSG
jgi:hypothetical protein